MLQFTHYADMQRYMHTCLLKTHDLGGLSQASEA